MIDETEKLIDPTVYQAGPLLCDVAKIIYDALELVEVCEYPIDCTHDIVNKFLLFSFSCY